MNIENSLGMVQVSGNPNSSGSVGKSQSNGGNVLESKQGSLFQKLISQMMMQKYQTAEAGGSTLSVGNQKEENGDNSDLLTELLLAGGNLSKLKLQNIEKELTMSGKEQSGESNLPNDKGEQLELIQEFLSGLTNAAPNTNLETVNSVIHTTDNNALNAVAGAVQENGNVLGVLERQKNIVNKEQNPAFEEVAALAEGKSEQKDALELSGKGKSIVSQENGLLAEGNSASMNWKDEKQETVAQSQIKMPEGLSEKQSAIGGHQAEEGMTAIVDKLKGDAEIRSSNQSDAEYLNPLQNTGAAKESAELNPLPQSVEKAEPYRQIGDEILSKLEQKGTTEFKMQLQPEDLGQIDIKLKLNNGKLMIDILAASSKTQALLTSQVDKLISSMGLQHVQVESVQVNQQMNSQSQNNQQNQGFMMNSGMDFSQRRQQEQSQEEFLKGNNLTGINDMQLSETQETSGARRIQSMRFNTHKMNYAV